MTIAKEIAFLSCGIRFSSPNSDDEIDDIRALLADSFRLRPAVNIEGLDEEEPPAEAWSDLFDSSKLAGQQLLRRAKARFGIKPGARTPLIARTEPSLSALADIGHIDRANLSAMVAHQRIGPFLAPDGTERSFIIHKPAVRFRVQDGSAAWPAILLTAKPVAEPSPKSFKIGASTVWLQARLFDPSAADGRYVGLRLRQGQLSFTDAPTVTADLIAPSGGLNATLVCDTMTSASPEGAGKCRLSAVTMEPVLKVIIVNGEATLEEFRGQVEIGGAALEVRASGRGQQDAEIGRLVFSGVVEATPLVMSTLSHDTAQFAGTITISRAGWSLPIVSITNPLDLAEAADRSAFILQSTDPVSVTWVQSGAEPVTLPGVTLLVGLTCLTVYAAADTASASAFHQDFQLWSLSERANKLRVRCLSGTSWKWVFWCDRDNGPGIAFTGATGLVLDKPAEATGAPLQLPNQNVLVVITAATDVRRVTVVGLPGPVPGAVTGAKSRLRMLALENAYLSASECQLIGFSGVLLTRGRVVEGGLGLLIGVANWIPTLPDPYVTNVAVPGREFTAPRGSIGWLTATVGWVDAAPEVKFDGLMGAPSVKRAAPSERDSQAAPDSGPDQAATLGLPMGSDLSSFAASRPDTQVVDASEQALAQASREEQRSRKRRLDRAKQATQAFEALTRRRQSVDIGLRDYRLLDVSTRKDQIGVSFGRGAQPDLNRNSEGIEQALAAGAAYVVSGVSLHTSLAAMRVFMVPQVQWEPVRTLPRDQKIEEIGYFPTPLASADDGGATVLGSRSASLMPTIPDLAVDRMISEYPGGERVGLLTTLPFGLKAVLTLEPGSETGRLADTLSLEQPHFQTRGGLSGALQLKVSAEGGISAEGQQSPSFKGFTVQLLNGVDLETGAPLGISVLGGTKAPESTVESMLNTEFASVRPKVPVTRFDLSGYGASNFSDWVNPYGAFAEATKVQFRILVGRTALEIVKFTTIEYPFGIKMTRSVTIERRGGGGVVRRDTGWEATTPGLFDFRYVKTDSLGKPIKDADGNDQIADSPYVVHPGLIEGVYNVTRIRPTGAAPVRMTSPTVGDIVLSPIYFDADVQVNGLQGQPRTRARGVLGFLQVEPVGKPISAEDLAFLIAQQGPIGGPVDALVEVGQSKFKMRALRIEIDAAREGTAPRFVGAVRAAPIFGSSGAWSVIRMPPPGGSPISDDCETVGDGAALIRSGAAGVPVNGAINIPGPRGDFRFADAVDLFREATPAADYGFLQTTPTHAFVYRRPRVAPGASEISSTLAPCLADAFARFTGDGLFPPIQNVIELNDQPYRLAVNPQGLFSLSPPVSLSSIPRGDLELANTASQSARVVYADATLQFGFDATSWFITMPGLKTWSGFSDLPKLVGMMADLVGSSTGPYQLRDMTILLDPTIDDILSFIPGMSPRDKTTIDLAASNLKQKFKLKIPFAKRTLIRVPPAPAEPVFIEVNFKAFASAAYGSEKKEPSEDSPTAALIGFVDFGVGFEVTGKIHPPPIKPFFVVLGLEFEVGTKIYLQGPKSGKPKGEITIMAYVGMGIGGNIGPFKASAFAAAGPAVQRDISGWHVGGVVKLEAEIDLRVVTINVAGEFLGIYKDDGAKKIIAYEGEVAINVEMLFFSLSETAGVEGEMDL